MPAKYVVRRRDAYHFRLRVPHELVSVIGSRELHSSLGLATRKTAALRASFLAFHAHSFFGKVRSLMDTKTPQQIAALVADWRQRMFTRDGEIRRLIELDRHDEHDSDSYAEHCEAVSALADETLSALVPTSEAHEGSRRPSKREQMDALGRTKVLMTANEPDSDHLPLMDVAAFEAMDDVSALDVARRFLLSMGEVYGRKASMCADAFATVGRHGYKAPTEAHARPAKGNAPHHSDEATETGPTLAAAWDEYVQRQSATEAAWTAGAPETPRRAWADFVAVIGGERRASTLTKEDARRYERFADQQPKRRGTKYSSRTTAELIGMVERGEIPREDRRAARTVAKDTSAIWSFLRWCKTEHGTRIAETFEFKTIGSNTPGDEEDRYEAWTTKELQTMFDPAMLGAEMRKRRLNAIRRVGGNTPYPDGRQFADFPWILLIALYTGARRGEILGLTVNDIAAEHEETKDQSGASVPVFNFVETEERGLKTKASRRCVPIHPDLIELGILELATVRRGAGARRLLYSAPDISKAGKWTGNVFKKYTEALALHVPLTKVFHSFRHTFKTQASGRMDDGQRDAIIGHRPKDSTGGTYVHAMMVPQNVRWAMMKEMTFSLDLQGLKVMLRELADETEQ